MRFSRIGGMVLPLLAVLSALVVPACDWSGIDPDPPVCDEVHGEHGVERFCTQHFTDRQPAHDRLTFVRGIDDRVMAWGGASFVDARFVDSGVVEVLPNCDSTGQEVDIGAGVKVGCINFFGARPSHAGTTELVTYDRNQQEIDRVRIEVLDHAP
jgi:hypothetical protein